MLKKDRTLDADFISALEVLRNENDNISTATLFALSDVDRLELENFAAAWLDVPAPRRRYVTRAMRELAEERIEADFNRLFRFLMDDEDAEVREHAINGLGED